MRIYGDQDFHIIRKGEATFEQQKGKALCRPQWI
jgi:hypothetical protein